ncbi:unnamed protein product [Cyprideis torosa]|uniref:Uncharacterized protein n=1 Tax=Cyprideis torosa TaxID=163714 RepID=A0A7R8ZJ93_9CRUS|nr:unnamed protein product [Cyprideis torosa]CAG0879339.1 unnamed protein product [Cyprideis torosa]
MNCHQILTGACNAGDRTFSVGSVEGVAFTAYAAGCNIVILAKNFERVQIIPGVVHSNTQIRCIDCSTDTGKIAAAYGSTVVIYEPVPLVSHNSSHKLDYRWLQTSQVDADCTINTLAWDQEGTRLLTAGEKLQLWENKVEQELADNGDCIPEETESLESKHVRFDLGADDMQEVEEVEIRWECIWSTTPASPVMFLAYSCDGSLFATAGENDRLVKIWFESRENTMGRSMERTLSSVGSQSSASEISYSYVYVAHPRAVSGFQWRKTSKYMPKASVANMLVTSCRDNICRIWVETILPDDGLVSVNHFAPYSGNIPKFKTQRHRHRFLQRLKHMKTCFHFRRRVQMMGSQGPANKGGVGAVTNTPSGTGPSSSTAPATMLPSDLSAHELHTGVPPPSPVPAVYHFHLAASINAETDIPLVPSMVAKDPEKDHHQFVLHWVNSKEMQFTEQAEEILLQLGKKALGADSNGMGNGTVESPTPGSAGSEGPTVEDSDDDDSEEIGDGSKPGLTLKAPEGPFPAAPSPNMTLMSNTTSLNSIATATDTSSPVNPPLGDALDRKIEALLKDWHHSADLLFAVHPVDGSFLVWTIHFLDEFHPGSFRQAQVTFSSRLPNALPLGDALSMSSNLALYSNHILLDLKHALRLDTLLVQDMQSAIQRKCDETTRTTEFHDPEEVEPLQEYSDGPSPTISMLSKHDNGTLNLWKITFAENSKYSTILSIGHASRVCGHRYGVNALVSHPVLPLLLSTSHHNATSDCLLHDSSGPCSELILWKIDPVGPLSKSGGITELAHSIRIVSQQSTARPGCIIELDFIQGSIVDWGISLFFHVFQEQMVHGGAVKEQEAEEALDAMNPHCQAMVDLHTSCSFRESFYLALVTCHKEEGTNVHMWKLTLASQGAIAPGTLTPSNFESPTPYSQLSQVPENGSISDSFRFQINDSVVEENEDKLLPYAPVPVIVATTKLGSQKLPLPAGVRILDATPAAGHLSSASIYPACYAPYLIASACSDRTLRFWKCQVVDKAGDGPGFEWSEWELLSRENSCSAIELLGKPMGISAAYSGRVAAIYKSVTPIDNGDNGGAKVKLCVAIYECESTGGSEWALEDTIMLKEIHESHRGETALEEMDLTLVRDAHLAERRQRALDSIMKTFSHEDLYSMGENEHCGLKESFHGLLAVPSFSTLQKLRKVVAEKPHAEPPLERKHLMQVDWVSREDGSHILTISYGEKMSLFTPVSSDVAQMNLKAMKEQQHSRPVLKKTSSMVMSNTPPDEVRWMRVRQVALKTADGMPPLPMQLSWTRHGILVVGMDTEIHIYSQWRPAGSSDLDLPVDDTLKSRSLTEQDLRSLAQGSASRMRQVGSLTNLTRNYSYNSTADALRKGKTRIEAPAPVDEFPDFGLFEASRIVCPILPQYHPKQLMELLNSGKIRRVKAILAHLVRCIISSESKGQPTNTTVFSQSVEEDDKKWGRSRALSISGAMISGGASMAENFEEVTLDYVEINAVPPLPLWLLLLADSESKVVTGQQQDSETDYSGLFGGVSESENDKSLEDVLSEDMSSSPKGRRASVPQSTFGFAYFGLRESRQLSRLLTHTHLPGLSSLDQMHLLALADTVASCNVDFAEKFAIREEQAKVAKENLQGIAGKAPQDSLDDCGLRFLLAMRHHIYLMRCLPRGQRAPLQVKGMATSNLVWAFHSESEEELLQLLPSYDRGDLTWPELRELGAGWWLRNNTLLRRCMEKVAKAAFSAKKDPLDAALYYLAMKKKSLVWGLFRSVQDERMTQFFANNFNEDRWRKAALKNAFALLGKQRFEHAVAFFLLGSALHDAIEVCINKLNDFQLAMVICRLYQGELETTPKGLRQLLQEHILGQKAEGPEDLSKAHPDAFLRSMAHWILGDYSGSLNTLLQTNVGTAHSEFQSKCRSDTADPSVFNFYVYLRTHPLLLRQLTINQDVKRSFLSVGRRASTDNQLLAEDGITPMERRLYFTTAHSHFQAGCPTLALEVLSKLPGLVKENANNLILPDTVTVDSAKSSGDALIATGTLQASTKSALDTSSTFDWSAPVTRESDELKLSWSDDEEEDSEAEEKSDVEEDKTKSGDSALLASAGREVRVLDIMAQQLKYIACLQILMEELSTLANGCETDGGQMRYHLYIWLERMVDALRQLCGYGAADEEEGSAEKPTLHEILLADKLDFEEKLQRAAKRREWLKRNQTLLRTLHSYCALHGASGGGLATVRVELIILLQELQQERLHQQLQSPLPLPTTIPLIAASVAANKTVVNDPIRSLQSWVHDTLSAIVDMSCPPMPGTCDYRRMFVLRDLSIALSTSIYQSLCDSDAFLLKQQQGGSGSSVMDVDSLLQRSVVYQNSHLTAGYRRRRALSSADEPPEEVATPPNKWPGVTSLRALLTHARDEDSPRLNGLLCEAFISTYMSLLVFGLATCDCHVLYRLASQSFSETTWAALFGGGAKKLLKVSTPKPSVGGVAGDSKEGETGIFNTLNKQRLKLNMRLLSLSGSQGMSSKQNMKQDRPTFREMFVPPMRSILSQLMQKLELPHDMGDIDYDSSESVGSEPEEEVEEEYDDPLAENVFEEKPRKRQTENVEHSDPRSYSWGIIRYALVKVAQSYLMKFLSVAGLEMQGPPDGYIPGCYVEPYVGGPAMSKYKAILIPTNTPFLASPGRSVRPIKRLWQYLVHQEIVQDIFIRYIFSSRRRAMSVSSSIVAVRDDTAIDSGVMENTTVQSTLKQPLTESSLLAPVKIIHKEQDSVSAFCINQVTPGLMALATLREIQELDISLLLQAPACLEDECEFDILNLHSDPDAMATSAFLAVSDRSSLGGASSSGGAGPSTQNGHNPSIDHGKLSHGKATSLVVQRKVEQVKRLSAHPLLPLYLSGSQDGSVSMWEWGHLNRVSQPRTPANFAKVTRCRFSNHGTKFGVADADGNVSLWQVGLSALSNRPYFTLQCHSKTTSDFIFVGSSSLMATAGYGAENKNLGLWDTLLPQRKSLVYMLNCHEQGANCLVYAPQHQVIISGGRKGDIAMFDIRQKVLRHTFTAHHHSAIKCITMDPHEEFFVTGSADGDIKVWGLGIHNLLYSFPAEHARSSFFKNMGQGVTQLEVPIVICCWSPNGRRGRDTQTSEMGAYLSKPDTKKDSCLLRNVDLTIGASSMRGWRAKHESAQNVISKFGKDEDSFFAIYDGHGGPEISIYVALHLPALLLDKLQCSEDHKSPNEMFIEVFREIDHDLANPLNLPFLSHLAGKDVLNRFKKESEQEELAGLLMDAEMDLENVVASYEDGSELDEERPRQQNNQNQENTIAFDAAKFHGLKSDVIRKVLMDDRLAIQRFIAKDAGLKPPPRKFFRCGGRLFNPEFKFSDEVDQKNENPNPPDFQRPSCRAIAGSTLSIDSEAGPSEAQNPDVLEKTAESEEDDNRTDEKLPREIATIDNSSSKPKENSTKGNQFESIERSVSDATGDGVQRMKIENGNGNQELLIENFKEDSGSQGSTSCDCKEAPKSGVQKNGQAVSSENNASNGNTLSEPPCKKVCLKTSSPSHSADREEDENAEHNSSTLTTDSKEDSFEHGRASNDSQEDSGKSGKEESEESDNPIKKYIEETESSDIESESSGLNDISIEQESDSSSCADVSPTAVESDSEYDHELEEVGIDLDSSFSDEEDLAYNFRNDVLADDERPAFMSGSTALCVLLQKDKLFLASVGNSLCVLGTADGKALELNSKHSPKDPAEKKRIFAAKGKVTDNGLINGGAGISRTLGDHLYKSDSTLTYENQLISSVPEVKEHQLTEEDEFMVFQHSMGGCCPLWRNGNDERKLTYRAYVESFKERSCDVCCRWIPVRRSNRVGPEVAPTDIVDGGDSDRGRVVEFVNVGHSGESRLLRVVRRKAVFPCKPLSCFNSMTSLDSTSIDSYLKEFEDVGMYPDSTSNSQEHKVDVSGQGVVNPVFQDDDGDGLSSPSPHCFRSTVDSASSFPKVWNLPESMWDVIVGK